MIIETERLILRRYKASDLKDYWEYVSHSDVGPNCGWEPYKTIDKAKERLDYEISNQWQYALELKESGKVIGSIEIMKPDENSEAKGVAKEIGYISNPKYWGKGYMTEALRAMIKFCMDKLNTDEVISGYYQPNIGSGRVQQKAEMKNYKSVQDMIVWYKTGKPCAGIYSKITKEAYLASPLYQKLKIKIYEEEIMKEGEKI